MATYIKAGGWETLCDDCKGPKRWLNLEKFITKIIRSFISSSGGLRRNEFIATEGQTEFVVDFTANDNYLVFINDAKQSRFVVTRSGNTFTTPPLEEGWIVEIYN